MILLATENTLILPQKLKTDYELYLFYNLISSISLYFCFYKQHLPPTRYLRLPNI